MAARTTKERAAQARREPEMPLHELGESVAAAVASVQHELARYPNALGAYVLDELELQLPVSVRVDALGQPLVRVLPDEAPREGAGSIRIRMRAALGAKPPEPVAAPQPLSTLRVLTPKAIEKLEEHRVFSVQDLLRVARTEAGRKALRDLRLDAPLERVLDRASLLVLPTLPRPVAQALLETDVRGPDGFLAAKPAALAKRMTQTLKQEVTPDAVREWQRRTAEVIRIPVQGPPAKGVESSRLDLKADAAARLRVEE